MRNELGDTHKLNFIDSCNRTDHNILRLRVSPRFPPTILTRVICVHASVADELAANKFRIRPCVAKVDESDGGAGTE